MRRREMLEFAVLGLLHEDPLHGYELRRRLNTRLGAFRALSFGTLYPCPASLQGQDPVSVDRDEPPTGSSRRQRITYTITDAGRTAFAQIAGRTDPGSWADDAFDVRVAFFARTEREVRLRILRGPTRPTDRAARRHAHR
uniref:PadR family transcriptional regulator n=1 Tax=Janibacter limosus TaxID=53458 RepID=A0AC61U439_9MICO|nr:PadR family transcriptional regulator [Janibacter limosus]